MPDANSRAWWQHKHQRYQERGDLRERADEFRVLAAWCRGPVIEVGCAFGAFSRYLPAECGYLGLDIGGVARAREMNPGRIFVDGDVFAVAPFLAGAAETVVAMQFIEHFEAPVVALDVLRKISRRRLVFSVPRGEPSPSQRSAKGDGHMIGWRDEDAMLPLLSPYGRVEFVAGAQNHISGIVDWGGAQ